MKQGCDIPVLKSTHVYIYWFYDYWIYISFSVKLKSLVRRVRKALDEVNIKNASDMNTEYLASRPFFDAALESFNSLPRVFTIDVHPMGVYSSHWTEATQNLSAAEKVAMANQMKRLSDIAFNLATSTPESLQLLEDAEVEKQLWLLANAGYFVFRSVCIERMRISDTELDSLVNSGRVIEIKCREQGHLLILYPDFYADKAYPLSDLLEVTAALGEISPIRKFRFFQSEFEALDMRTPLDLIEEGRGREVMKLAISFAKSPLFELRNVFNSTVKSSTHQGKTEGEGK